MKNQCDDRKRVKNQCDDERVKQPKKRKRMKKKRSTGLRQKEDMVNLLPGFKLARFLSPKKDKTRYSQPFKRWIHRMPRFRKNRIKKGDIVNLSQLLFTKDRDFLITYNDRDRPVRAEHLEEARKHPSITKLLASPERNHLINNNNQVVPLHTLEDKVVGLYFYEDYSDELTIQIQEAYEPWARGSVFATCGEENHTYH
ncbi:hypothetical protein POM88_005133 [Heracleum sosnowskyi]|uniref:Uncharacterized protein n=1 Tax=Heracleum sosnowskyi TaxID=360622 RepID=A0AAD8NF16_9APIA|nr:hypothetical protein POM88_005133 [Heracleum sosnowskyi]